MVDYGEASPEAQELARQNRKKHKQHSRRIRRSGQSVLINALIGKTGFRKEDFQYNLRTKALFIGIFLLLVFHTDIYPLHNSGNTILDSSFLSVVYGQTVQYVLLIEGI